ncbi:hypothetical protein CERZMDRAFT_83049 [Cercospora zeae-maydis SCOH1-5]|uniref:Uncharacterized protein n=1 Tax=Cercospora zeae-maydis SCOH1-5 TaxID=717836 RepID=A0A6A6FLS1_9PEZI|nr:hypothetical protein CERZMDRAFT_83049 [Cercospora zeae-maydis SCOH1-5]
MSINLQQIRLRHDAVWVPMNQVSSGAWSADLQFLATEYLNGCTAVAIVSEYGGILAHIAPRTSTTTGDQNVRDLMTQVVHHFTTGRNAGLFPSATAVVLAAVYENEIALPDAVEFIRRVLERLDLPIRYQKYRVRRQGEARVSGETSFVLHGRRGMRPGLYVNGTQLHR